MDKIPLFDEGKFDEVFARLVSASGVVETGAEDEERDVPPRQYWEG